MAKTTSSNGELTGHDGVFMITRGDVPAYIAQYKPVILRHQRTIDTFGPADHQHWVAKGSTYDRVLIFPTKPMLEYLKTKDLAKLPSRHRLYVAVTRARFSVAFVVP